MLPKFDGKPTEENIKAWREEHKAELNPSHTFVQGSGNALMEETELKDENERDALKDVNDING